MINVEHPRDPLHQGMIFLRDRENDMVTTIRNSNNYGLHIEQYHAGKKTGSLMYGNDQVGYNFYIHLLKLLLASNVRLPPRFQVKSPIPQHDMEMGLDARIEYELIQPYPATHTADMGFEVQVEPVILRKQKGLKIGLRGQPALFISTECAFVLSQSIPKLFPHDPLFKEIRNRIMRHKLDIRPLSFEPIRTPLVRRPEGGFHPLRGRRRTYRRGK